MSSSSFAIEFFDNEPSEKLHGTLEAKYVVQVQLISKSFQLFEVSNIKTIKENRTYEITKRCILTSYTFAKDEPCKWKNALTLKTNHLFELIGRAINEKFQHI